MNAKTLMEELQKRADERYNTYQFYAKQTEATKNEWLTIRREIDHLEKLLKESEEGGVASHEEDTK